MGAHGSAHIVDRALAVHALLGAGRSPAEVQRRLGKSKGYVSVLGYLGAALAGLEPEDLGRLRSRALTPCVVWPLVTRARTEERTALKEARGAEASEAARDEIHRRIRDRATVQLRSALRAHGQAAAAGLTAPPKARGGRRPRATDATLGALAWDSAAWAADPVAYVDQYLGTLVAVHRAVVDQAARAVRQAGAEQAIGAYIAAAGETSLRRLTSRVSPARWRALADGARLTCAPREREALVRLGSVSRALDLSVRRDDTRPDPPTAEEIEADLAG